MSVDPCRDLDFDPDGICPACRHRVAVHAASGICTVCVLIDAADRVGGAGGLERPAKGSSPSSAGPHISTR